MYKLSSPQIILPEQALPGRSDPVAVADRHYVNGNSMEGPFPEGMEMAMFAMGCFWGAERRFWELAGVWTTAVGYAAGYTPNPSYEEVCSGMTGHTEAVRLVFDSNQIAYTELLENFWQGHDPTQGMRQGNDRGTQYRSGIYCFDDSQYKQALTSRDVFQSRLNEAGYGNITTEIISAPVFYFAEDYHQQYLAKNPNGYCGLGGTGVEYPSSG